MAYRTKRLFDVRTTLKKMLSRRGFAVSPTIENETLESFEYSYLEDPQFSLTFDARREVVMRHNNKVDDLLLVFFADIGETNIGIGPIREFLLEMEKKQCCEAIVVIPKSLTSPGYTLLRELMTTRKISITPFSESELLFDLFEHVRVPRHTLLGEDEKQKLLQDLNITPNLLPKIQKSDPVAKYLGLCVGDIVQIRRYSITVGEDVYYRVVVDIEEV